MSSMETLHIALGLLRNSIFIKIMTAMGNKKLCKSVLEVFLIMITEDNEIKSWPLVTSDPRISSGIPITLPDIKITVYILKLCN